MWQSQEAKREEEIQKALDKRAKKWARRKSRFALGKSYLTDVGAMARFLKPTKVMSLEEYERSKEKKS